MAENFYQSIAEVKSYIKNIAFNLNPDECKLFATSETEKHYSIIIPIPKKIAQDVWKFTEKLKEIEPTLLLNPKDLYHLTIYYFPLDRDPLVLNSVLREYFSKSSLEFDLGSLFFTPNGIGIGAFPQNENFINLRNLLKENFGFASYMTRLAPMTWITNARFTKKPTQALVKYLQENFDTKFGSFKAEEVFICENADKNLVGAKKLFKISLN